MSIRISEGGRLFGIMAGLGGAAMIFGSTRLSWTEQLTEMNRAESLAVLVLGLFVIAGAVCFLALGSRPTRMTAGALVVLAGAAGLVIAWAGPHSIGGVWAVCGAAVATGFGIVALLRSGGQAAGRPAAGRSPSVSSGPTASGDFATPPKRRMSDASLLALTVVAVVIVLVTGFAVVVQVVCSESWSWC